ncbi:outer membrane protein assembly factor BamB family protein [Horticoccus sp. 23ND18S-11]|uniref:outer membrane protein assembly factor BamB family protein n=1 Tax=Horticoccus sp. 23ND18S-11 TaxID=3391832 RepID=UPI0039C8F8B9
MLAVIVVAAGISPAFAQQDGERLWRSSVGGFVTLSSPALSPDGLTVYVGVETSTGGGRIVALSTRDGSSRWGQLGRVLSDPVESSPAVGPDGTVYIGAGNGKLYALNPATGASLWEITLGGFISSSPAIGSDGTIYVGGTDGVLHAVAPTGVARWNFSTGSWIDSSPAVGVDGTIYVGSNDGNLYAVTPAGQEKWRFATNGVIFSSPAIGVDGTIYVGSRDQRLYAITPDGTKRWDYVTNGPIDASPTLGADGTIYFAADRSFYALRPGDAEERLRWKADIGSGSISGAAVRADGSIIFGADSGVVRALLPADGTEKWRFDTKTGPDNLIESSPVIGPDGAIYVGSFDGALYKLAGNGSPLSAFSSWPSFHRDARHSARIVLTNTGGRLVNIATRAQAGGTNSLVAGFVVQGAAASGRAYMVRAVGPGLGQLGFAGFVPDPKLEIYSGQVSLQANDNWLPNDDVSGFSLADTAAGVGAFPLVPGSRDAAMIPLPLPPGSYTAHVGAANGGQGVALVEVYDARAGDSTGRIINLSTRGQVGTGANFLIAGVVVSGTGSMRLLLRGIGPGLAQFGVPGVLARPRMEIFRGAVSLGSNAGWVGDGLSKGDLAGAAATVAAFPLSEASLDSAMVFDALPGEYTIQISGVGGTSGEAMVEVYVLP